MRRRSLQALLHTASAAADCRLLARRLPVGAAAGHRQGFLHHDSIRLVFATAAPWRPVHGGGKVVCGGTSQPQACHSGAIAVPSRNVHLATNQDRKDVDVRINALISKLKKEGIQRDRWQVGARLRMVCPKPHEYANGTRERADEAFESLTDKEAEVDHAEQRNGYRQLSEEDLNLEPLCNELVAYFAERMISAETLRRNLVLQRRFKDKIVIAFTYRRSGILVGCKYREASKKFFQEPKTEKILYGLDDIHHGRDIIVVEGEIDKLSMEEAGYLNCVSVPNGAPARVSSTLPDKEKDKKFQYLWNCRQYLDSASRIILATDADLPGQALAAELARRLGKERCWRVTWPEKNKTDICKDANEVLQFLGRDALRKVVEDAEFYPFLGRDALRKVVEDAEFYPLRGLFRFKGFFPEIDKYYHGIYGDELGISTGWKSTHKSYKVGRNSWRVDRSSKRPKFR